MFSTLIVRVQTPTTGHRADGNQIRPGPLPWGRAAQLNPADLSAPAEPGADERT